jgi:hypothetical protein
MAMFIMGGELLGRSPLRGGRFSVADQDQEWKCEKSKLERTWIDGTSDQYRSWYHFGILVWFVVLTLGYFVARLRIS